MAKTMFASLGAKEAAQQGRLFRVFALLVIVAGLQLFETSAAYAGSQLTEQKADVLDQATMIAETAPPAEGEESPTELEQQLEEEAEVPAEAPGEAEVELPVPSVKEAFRNRFIQGGALAASVLLLLMMFMNGVSLEG